MFDDLDDTNPTVPGPAARTAVGARVRRIRQRRTAWAAGATSLVLAVVAGTAAGLREPGRDRVTQVLDTTESPFETIDPSADPVFQTPTPTVSPTAEPTPTETPDRPDLTTEPPEPSGSVSPTPYVFPGLRPDGKPGWSGGFSGCTEPDGLPAEADERPFPFVRFSLDLPDTLPAGVDGEGTFSATNDGDQTVGFYVRSDIASVMRHVATGRLSADYFTDVIGYGMVYIEPGQTKTWPVHVETTVCGDTPDDSGPLPPGEYVVAAAVEWSGPVVKQSSPSPSEEPTASGEPTASPTPKPSPTATSGTWGSPRLRIRLT